MMKKVFCLLMIVGIACFFGATNKFIGNTTAEMNDTFVIYMYNNEFQTFLEKNYVPYHRDIEFVFQICPLTAEGYYYSEIDRYMNTDMCDSAEAPDIFMADGTMMEEYDKYRIDRDLAYQIVGKKDNWLCLNAAKFEKTDPQRMGVADKMLRMYSRPFAEVAQGDEKLVLIKSVKTKETKIRIPVGESFAPVIEIKPENATIKALVWKSSDESVCTVDEDGIITAVAEGKCSIESTTVDGSRKRVKISVTIVSSEH